MKESKLNHEAAQAIRDACRHAKIYKHADRWTAGIPDTSVTWHGITSWLEFKLLSAHESIHAQLDPLQLVELVTLESASYHHAWVIAYRKAGRGSHDAPSTEIYRPSALLHGRVPTVSTFASYHSMVYDLENCGRVRFPSFDHRAVAALISFTHRGA